MIIYSQQYHQNPSFRFYRGLDWQANQAVTDIVLYREELVEKHPLSDEYCSFFISSPDIFSELQTMMQPLNFQ